MTFDETFHFFVVCSGGAMWIPDNPFGKRDDVEGGSEQTVLYEDESVVPGLYATGVALASVMGRVCPGAGSGAGPSFVRCFVAAQHAVQQPQAAV